MPTPEKISTSSFTAVGKRVEREIVLETLLALPIVPGQPSIDPKKPPISVKALWDTGATHCAITKETAERLGLFPIDKAQVHHADGTTLQNVYALSLILPNRMRIPYVRATECKSTAGSFDFIIGMEIITAGDFAITNVGGKTTVSFRMPSLKTIDFVKDMQQDKNFSPDHHEKIGRNEPCPCGSGKKYKKCHGS